MTCLWTLLLFTALLASVSKLFWSNYCIKSRTPTVPSPSPIHSRNIAIEAAATNPEFTVPVMKGHPRDQAKVSVHDKWSLVGGTGGVKRNTPCMTTFITTSDIHTEYNVMHCHN